MTVTATIDGVEHTGNNVAEIVYTVFGPTATVATNASTGEHWGSVITVANGAMTTVATIEAVTGKGEELDVTTVLGNLRDVSKKIDRLDTRRGKLVVQRNDIVRLLLINKTPYKDIEDASGLSRSAVNIIRLGKDRKENKKKTTRTKSKKATKKTNELKANQSETKAIEAKAPQATDTANTTAKA